MMDMKKVLIAFVLVVLVCFTAILLAPYFVDLNRYKGTIVSQIKQQIHRDVDFKEIRLTILGGIGAEITGLTVADNPRFSGEDFLNLDAFQVHLEFLPLLKKEISIKKVILKTPVIKVLRDDKGEFNFGDLVGNTEEATPSKQKSSSSRPGTDTRKNSSSPLLAMFVVKELDIRDGKIFYTEQKRPPAIIDGIDLDMKDISLKDAISIKLSMRLPQAKSRNFELSGRVGPIGNPSEPGKIHFDVRMGLDTQPLEKLDEYVSLPVDIRSGIGRLDITAQGSLAEKIKSEVKIGIENLVIKQASGGEAVYETVPVAGNLETAFWFDYAGQKLDVETGLLTINDNKIAVRGAAVNLWKDPEWDITATGDTIDPSAIMKILPMYAGMMPQDIDFAGPVRFDVSSKGVVGSFDFKADADLGKMHLAYRELFDKSENVPMNLSCTGNMRGGIITAESLQAIFHQLTMNGTGRVDISKKIPAIDLQIQTQPIKLKGWEIVTPLARPYDPDGTAVLKVNAQGPMDNLAVNISAQSERLSFVVPEAEKTKKVDDTPRSSVQGMDVEIAARMKGNALSGNAGIKVKEGSVLDIAFDNLSSRVSLAPDKLLIESFDVNAFRGNIKTTGSYAFENGKWSVTPVLKDVASGMALDSLTQYKGIFSGALNGRFDVSGSGGKSFVDTVKAKGTFTLNNGQLNNVDLGTVLAGDFSKIQGVAELLGVEKETMARHETTSFDSLEGNINMAGGVVNISTLTLKNIRTSRDTDSLADLRGTADLNTQALNLKGDVTLSQKLSARLIKRTPELSAFLNNQQRIVLPVRIKGSLQKPAPALRTKEVNEALAKYYAKKKMQDGVDKLKERLGIPGGDDGTDKIIDNLLEGIFKK